VSINSGFFCASGVSSVQIRLESVVRAPTKVEHWNSKRASFLPREDGAFDFGKGEKENRPAGELPGGAGQFAPR
jgi:hypothetical protein